MGSLARAVPFRCQGKSPPGRAAGRSVVRTAAYNARDRLDIAETGERADYRRGRSELTFTGIFAPKDAPDWLCVTVATSGAELTAIRERLWNEVEKIEDRINSQFARALEINLPHWLSPEGRERLVKDWVRENFVRKGMVADVNLHAPHEQGDERNHHGHILLTLRRLDSDGWAPAKAREWNDKVLFRAWKQDLAEKCARMLEREGHKVEAERWRHGHLSLPQQRERAIARGDVEYAEACNREPTRHLGPHIKKMQERGIVSDVQWRRDVEAARFDATRAELADLKAELAAIEKEKAQLLQELSRQRDSPLSRATGGSRKTQAVGEREGTIRAALAGASASIVAKAPRNAADTREALATDATAGLRQKPRPVPSAKGARYDRVRIATIDYLRLCKRPLHDLRLWLDETRPARRRPKPHRDLLPPQPRTGVGSNDRMRPLRGAGVFVAAARRLTHRAPEPILRPRVRAAWHSPHHARPRLGYFPGRASQAESNSARMFRRASRAAGARADDRIERLIEEFMRAHGCNRVQAIIALRLFDLLRGPS